MAGHWAHMMSFRTSIRKKVFLFFLAAIIPPLGTLGVLSYVKSSTVINDQFGTSGNYAVKQLQIHLDSNLKEMEFIASDILAYMANPMQYMAGEPRNYIEFVEQRNFLRFLKVHNSPNILGVAVITSDGMVYGNLYLRAKKLLQRSWWNEIPDHAVGKFWTGLHDSSYYDSLGDTGPALSLVVPVQKTFHVDPGTKILVDLRAESLIAMLDAFKHDTHYDLTIKDAQGKPIYSSMADRAPKPGDIVWSQSLQSNGWTIEARMPKEQFYESSYAIRQYTLIVAAVSFVAALLLAGLFSTRITGRIRKINASMFQVGQGKLDARIPVESQDELGRLAIRFNSMTEQIRMLIDDISDKEQQKRYAELRALHYQINPHLMFNTLNSIQWKARINGQKEIAEMITHLTEVLSDSLDSSQDLIPLHQELESAAHFLAIQRFRFGDVFTCEEDVPAHCRTALIPRMTLQPLFENIFYHAFVDGRGTIRLRVRERDGRLQLVLKDDGAGIRPEDLPKVMSPHAPRKGRGGLGLYNVNEKFKLHYGSPYGLDVKTQHGQGTEIVAEWPFQKDEEVSDHGTDPGDVG